MKNRIKKSWGSYTKGCFLKHLSAICAKNYSSYQWRVPCLAYRSNTKKDYVWGSYLKGHKILQNLQICSARKEKKLTCLVYLEFFSRSHLQRFFFVINLLVIPAGAVWKCLICHLFLNIDHIFKTQVFFFTQGDMQRWTIFPLIECINSIGQISSLISIWAVNWRCPTTNSL